jgi:hypothetical protein
VRLSKPQTQVNDQENGPELVAICEDSIFSTAC